MLYGIDLAKPEIAQRRKQVVVVEGYTDVMAAHLAGVPTAVATCGTAFGADHIPPAALLVDADTFGGEVIFTFDGDAAGQTAALRAFEVRPALRHPDVRRDLARRPGPLRAAPQAGDAAVRDLIAAASRSTSSRSAACCRRTSTNPGRMAALKAAARIIGRIKDDGLRDRYAVSLDRWLGMMDEDFVLARVRAHSAPAPARPRGGP